MTDKQNTKWRWDDLDPLTRATLALFSGHIGEERGQLDGDIFLADLMSVFPTLDPEGIHKCGAWGGRKGLQNVYTNSLELVGDTAVRDVARTIGRLAGGSEGVMELAEQVGKEMIGVRRYDVHPALTVLSQMAIRNLDVTEQSMLA